MRPIYMHEFQISTSSLYSAISLKYTPEKVLSVLDKLSKNYITPDVERFIREHAKNFGKAKIILEDNKYFIECDDDNLFKTICSLEPVRKYYNRAKERGDIFKVEEKKDGYDDENDLETITDKEYDQMIMFMEKNFNSEPKKATKKKMVNRIEIDQIDVR